MKICMIMPSCNQNSTKYTDNHIEQNSPMCQINEKQSKTPFLHMLIHRYDNSCNCNSRNNPSKHQIPIAFRSGLPLGTNHRVDPIMVQTTIAHAKLIFVRFYKFIRHFDVVTRFVSASNLKLKILSIKFKIKTKVVKQN